MIRPPLVRPRLRSARPVRDVAAVALLALVVAGCGSRGSNPAAADPGVSVHAGSLTLSAARVPMPASPDVGVAYFRLTNDSDTSDHLVSASSPEARSVIAMKDVEKGGSMTMVGVQSLTVPPHGSVELQPGGLHLMLQHLTRHLAVGDHVRLDLRFAGAGHLTVTIPVTPIAGASEDPSDMGSMPGM